jgi:hypothetical protein
MTAAPKPEPDRLEAALRLVAAKALGETTIFGFRADAEALRRGNIRRLQATGPASRQDPCRVTRP